MFCYLFCIFQKFKMTLANNESNTTCPDSEQSSPLCLSKSKNDGQISKMLNELEILHTRILLPQILVIAGLEHIKFNCHVSHSKDRIDTLFFEANIPLYWILHVTDVVNENNVINGIHVTLLNFYVKEATKRKLTCYLRNTFKNLISLNF